MQALTIILCMLSGEPDRLLLDAIRAVENPRDTRAVGAAGERGPYRIAKPYWQDARVPWAYGRYVWSAPHCEVVMRRYWRRYGAETCEDKARCHNGGPKWRSRARADTARYWNKVRAAMEN